MDVVCVEDDGKPEELDEPGGVAVAEPEVAEPVSDPDVLGGRDVLLVGGGVVEVEVPVSVGVDEEVSVGVVEVLVGGGEVVAVSVDDDVGGGSAEEPDEVEGGGSVFELPDEDAEVE